MRWLAVITRPLKAWHPVNKSDVQWMGVAMCMLVHISNMCARSAMLCGVGALRIRHIDITA